MQITWLDLLAANIGAMLWLWVVMKAAHWLKTDRSKTAPLFILLVFLGLGLILFVSRGAIWLAEMDDDVIVPELVRTN